MAGPHEAVGKVTPNERDRIRKLHERKNAIKELCRSLLDADPEEMECSGLYKKILQDMERACADFDAWWDETSENYSWKRRDRSSWKIDFKTCEVFLVDES